MNPREVPLHEALSSFKRALVRKVLLANDGNRSRAAAVLKIERTSLLRLIRELRIADVPHAPRGRPRLPPHTTGRRMASRRIRPIM